jgi:hypothetical protein
VISSVLSIAAHSDARIARIAGITGNARVAGNARESAGFHVSATVRATTRFPSKEPPSKTIKPNSTNGTRGGAIAESGSVLSTVNDAYVKHRVY